MLTLQQHWHLYIGGGEFDGQPFKHDIFSFSIFLQIFIFLSLVDLLKCFFCLEPWIVHERGQRDKNLSSSLSSFSSFSS